MFIFGRKTFLERTSQYFSLGCLRAPWVLACAMRSLDIVITNFRSLFFSVFCFWPTSGNLPCAKICFPQYFGITKRYMQKKYFLGIFLQQKKLFVCDFSTFYGQRLVTAAWANWSPWIITLNFCQICLIWHLSRIFV